MKQIRKYLFIGAMLAIVFNVAAAQWPTPIPAADVTENIRFRKNVVVMGTLSFTLGYVIPTTAEQTKWNLLTPTALATGFTLAGGTTPKTLTLDTNITASALAPIASPTFTGTVTTPGLALTSTGRNLKTWWNFEDFIMGTFGTGSWRSSISGTSAYIYTESPTGLRPGILKLQTGTTTTGRAATISSSGYGEFLFGGGVYTIEGNIYITTLSNETDTYTLRFGFADDVTAAPTDGAYFQYTDVGGGTPTPNWYMCTANNTTITATVTTVAAVAGAWTQLKGVVNAAGTSVEYFINGISVGTVTTNIPTTTGRETSAMYYVIKSAGTTNRIFLIDWAWLHIDLTTSR